VPATLRLLDQTFEKHRSALPAKKKPSEYWRTNCMAGVSFMRRSEVAIRHEIGVKTMAFGRDYPHLEGSWPNTVQYLRGLFVGVSENELRAILGENLIRFLGLDRAKLAAIAARIGPGYDQIAGPGPELDPALLEHLNLRSGYLEPAEGEKRVGDMDALLRSDLRRMSPSGQIL
jgi:hypothetical protein